MRLLVDVLCQVVLTLLQYRPRFFLRPLFGFISAAWWLLRWVSGIVPRGCWSSPLYSARAALVLFTAWFSVVSMLSTPSTLTNENSHSSLCKVCCLAWGCGSMSPPLLLVVFVSLCTSVVMGDDSCGFADAACSSSFTVIIVG